MGTDLETQLLRWAERGHPRSAAVLLEEVDARLVDGDEVVAAPLQPTQTRRRKWAVALAAAVLAVVVVGLVAILRPFASDGIRYVDEPTTVSTTTPPVSPTTAAPAPGISSTPEPPTTVPVPTAAFEWDRVSHPILEEGTAARTVIHHQGEYLAVGITDEDGALWRSADGKTWTRTTDPAFAGVEFVDVVPYRDGLVVVGNTPLDMDSEDDPTPVIVLSEDGESWERVDTSDPEIWVHKYMAWTGPLKAVAVLGDRIIVVGTHIWISDDARTWTLVMELEGDVTVEGVAAGKEGIAAAGQNFDALSAAIVWYSTSGDEWTEIPVSTPGRLVSSMYTVAATSEGFVAGGLVGDDPGNSPEGGLAAADAMVWVSTDGLTWTSALDDREQFGGPNGQWINGFADTGDALVAVGTEMYNNRNSATAVVWESEDGGMSWQRVEYPDHRFGNLFEGWAEMNDVVFHDGTLLAVGYIEENKYRPGVTGVWLGTPSG